MDQRGDLVILFLLPKIFPVTFILPLANSVSFSLSLLRIDSEH
jgi:hypothetical protein